MKKERECRLVEAEHFSFCFALYIYSGRLRTRRDFNKRLFLFFFPLLLFFKFNYLMGIRNSYDSIYIFSLR